MHAPLKAKARRARVEEADDSSSDDDLQRPNAAGKKQMEISVADAEAAVSAPDADDDEDVPCTMSTTYFVSSYSLLTCVYVCGSGSAGGEL